MFISFEGIDGSGKSTQIQLLKKYFQQNNKEVIVLREPGGTVLSELIRDLLLNKNLEITPQSELLLFNAARNDLLSKVIIPALKEGKIVLCDRFFDSTLAYQSYGRGIDIEKVNYINDFSTYSISPDLTFYLKIDLETSAKRNIDKRKDRIEKAGDDFFDRVKNGFDELSKKYNRIKTVDANGTIDETHKLILKLLK